MKMWRIVGCGIVAGVVRAESGCSFLQSANQNPERDSILSEDTDGSFVRRSSVPLLDDHDNEHEQLGIVASGSKNQLSVESYKPRAKIISSQKKRAGSSFEIDAGKDFDSQSDRLSTWQTFDVDSLAKFATDPTLRRDPLSDQIVKVRSSPFENDRKKFAKPFCTLRVSTGASSPSPNFNTTAPTPLPTSMPTLDPTHIPTVQPTPVPTSQPVDPTFHPTAAPTPPTFTPTLNPTDAPTEAPTMGPTASPTLQPSGSPTESPTESPTVSPTESPTVSPTVSPTGAPSLSPTGSPTPPPTEAPTPVPSVAPTLPPVSRPPCPAAFFTDNIAPPVFAECTVIGSLLVRNWQGDFDFASVLPRLQQTDGGILFEMTPGLTSISGPAQPLTIGGSLQIQGATQLSTVQLPRVNAINGGMSISDNSNLQSFRLPQLQTLAGSCIFVNNVQLTVIEPAFLFDQCDGLN